MTNKGFDYTKLDEEIYMICFSQPRYPGEIKELLINSGRTTQQSQLLLNNSKSRITKLINEGWLKELTEDEKQKIIDDVNDKRANRRRYIQSTLNPIIEYFQDQIKLEKNERRQLKHLFEKKTFKTVFTWENGFHSFIYVKEFLFQLTFWTNIAIKYTDPYRMKNKTMSKTEHKKMFSDMIQQLMEIRNSIAIRIAPDFEIEWSESKRDWFYSFIEDTKDKLKPPLFDKLMNLSNNQMMFFEIAISLLASGEFVNAIRKTKFNKNK